MTKQSEARIYIKPIIGGEWKEISGRNLKCFSSLYEPCNNRPITISFTGELPTGHKQRTEWMKFLGILKRPRCTFKTIRRDCAKKNR